ncbi:MAG: ABC transporter ATP-binding protein [Kangiella sp.]|nr:MAG: ABC transporter ATP-binding protein [Kangiella sp.]
MTIELKNISLDVENQSYIYPTDLKLVDGGFNILLGTTLSGKTSLLRLMAGLEKPSSGEIWFDQKNVTGVSVRKRNLAMVYQQFINYPNMTVFENIASPLRVSNSWFKINWSKKEINFEVNKVSELLKLTPYLQRKPSELSGGQQQRIALARALIKKSKLVLLDEPLANLDYKLREELRDQLPKLFQDSGSTVVYATSEPMEALLLGGHTATLYQGQVTQFGVTHELYREPNNLLTAQIFSDPPLNTAKVFKKDGWIILTEEIKWKASGKFQSLNDGEYTLGFRPHHLVHENLSNQEQFEKISLKGRVLVNEISGSESTTHITVENNNWVSLTHGIHSFEQGEMASFCLHIQDSFMFDKDTGVRLS